MEPVSPLPVAVCLLLAWGTAFLLWKKFGKPLTHDRYATLDGLRGYLAFFVFMHHSVVWYFALRSNHWVTPPPSAFNHLGQSSVLLFFMITGFLFFSKLLDGRAKPIDWGRLFVSRILRIVPLYLAVMLLLFGTVAAMSGGLNEPLPDLLEHAASWLTFNVAGMPSINRFPGTAVIVAGVTWSLAYEWFFYLSLPALALLVGAAAPLPYLAMGCMALGAALLWHSPVTYPLSPFFAFPGGIAAAFAVRSATLRKYAPHPVATLALIACLATVAQYTTAYHPVVLALLSVVFILIACGNTLFGVLVHPASRVLGEMAYSIYLLHGFTLFILFRVILGWERAAGFAPLEHWGFIALATPVLILVSFASYRYIERPAMAHVNTATQWLKSRAAFQGDKA